MTVLNVKKLSIPLPFYAKLRMTAEVCFQSTVLASKGMWTLKCKLSSQRFYLYYSYNLGQQEQIQEWAWMRQLLLRPQGAKKNKHFRGISAVCSSAPMDWVLVSRWWSPIVQITVSLSLFVPWARSATWYRMAIKRLAPKISTWS